MSELKTFLGISTTIKLRKYEDKFDVIYDDAGTMILASKATYLSEKDEDLPEFKYKYILNCFDMQAFGTKEKSIVIQLLMCPLVEYVNSKVISDITDEPDYWFHDAARSGILPNLGDEYVNYEEAPEDEHGNSWYDYYYNLTENKDFLQTLNAAATIIDAINMFFNGWGIDKVWNSIGNTGWDLLNNLLNGEDWLKAGLDRLKKEK